MVAYKSIIKLIPDTLRNECFNIGIVLYCRETGYLQMRTDVSKIKLIKSQLYPNLDINLIDNAIRDVDDKFFNYKNTDKIMNICDIYNGMIQFEKFTSIITFSIEEEMKLLMDSYVHSEYWIKE